MSEEGGYGDASYAFTNTLNKHSNKDRCGFEGVKGFNPMYRLLIKLN